jgi:hypothetical protein
MPTPSDLTDAQLENVMLALQLACGRAKFPLDSKRRQWYCFSFQVFKTEADLRGLPTPPVGGHVGDLPKGAI